MLINTLQSSARFIRYTKILQPQNVKMTISKQKTGWVHRVPKAVLNEEIVLETAEAAPVPRKYVEEVEEHRPMKSRPPKCSSPKKPVPVVESKNTYNEDGIPNFKKLEDNDRKLSTLMLTIKSRKLRERNQQILLEGHRLIVDAIKAGAKPEIILFSRTPDLMKLPLPNEGVKLYKVPYKTIQLWSNLTTPPGIIGIFHLPDSIEKAASENSIPLTIICDNVREPGNLGSILRAAAGVGCEHVILTKGCVDVWEPKVLRSACGAHFRMSITKSAEWDAIQGLISPTANVYVADNNVSVDFDAKLDSITDETSLESDSEEKLSESTSDRCENDFANEKNEESIECNSKGTEVKDISQISYRRARLMSTKELTALIPVIPYYAADFTTSDVIVIVGGETEGLSYESLELVRKQGGVRVNIPLTNEIESLNTGMALGIVAFEVKRQFIIVGNSIKK